MTEAELTRAVELAREAVVKAGHALKPHFGNVEAESKGEGSIAGIVTALDRQTEQFLAKELGRFSTDVGFRGEEFGVHTEAPTTWLVDPIDGTAHFVRGLPFCTTMVALIEDGSVVMSAIHDFVRGDTYWAAKGLGAHCNDEKISVSQRTLEQSLLSFETNQTHPDNHQKYLELGRRAGLIHMINCGFEFAMVASGRLDGRIALDPWGQDWDFAPGSLLVSEAGGVATNIGKSTYDYRDHNYIITNPLIHAELTTGPNALFPVV